MVTPQVLELALQQTHDRESFLKSLLIDALQWPIPEHVDNPEDISFPWSASDLRAEGLHKKLADGKAWQIQSLQANQHWGIFLLEFKHPDAFTSGRGLTGPLRSVLRGLVPSKRHDSALATWKREHLLFICTHAYQHYRFAYFKAPTDNTRAAPLAAFGWGPDMPARTACEFNLPALEWPDLGTTAEDWTQRWAAAFDVEKVTSEFYKAYATLFAAIEKAISAENNIAPGDELRMFTQTLVNRLMFLRFLERKGWLKFKGREDYLRALYDGGPFAKKSFYKGRLLPLFFEGLATEQHVPSDAFGDVPFLNGGLFEPTDLDRRIKDVPYAALGALIGKDGLFYRFNFTVEESTPLDIQVAVDPEMLGKVFEELVTGRHESGSYYTPRPIVSFMCREALKGYLASKTKAKAEAIAALVDQATVTGLTEAHGRQILESLDALKGVDPACGSGAYLLGLLHELVAIYRLLISEKLVKDKRSLYDLKLRIISHNLYGVDIDPFATSIAMLRLWLSLEVEADEPMPLPNLDFKIETGDSLLGPDPRASQNTLEEHRTRAKAGELLLLKEQYLTAHGDMRDKYRENIKAAEKVIEELLAGWHDNDGINWRVQFAEVFAYKDGFDIVVGNPPYVRQEQIKDIKPELKKVFECYTGVADLFVYFYERGVKLLNTGGQFAFITSNKWYRSGYGEKLRTWLAKSTQIRRLIDFGDAPVFQAIAYPTIVLLERSPPEQDASFAALTWQPGPTIETFASVVREQSFDIPQKSLDKSGWRLEASAKRDLLDKLRATGVPLGEYCKGQFYRGIGTGLNDAFVVDRANRDRLLAEHPSSVAVLKPYLRGRDVKRWQLVSQDLWLIYIPWHFPLHEDPSITAASRKAEREFEKRYPAVYKHLSNFKSELSKRDKAETEIRYEWYAIARPRSEIQEAFEGPKIVYPDIYEHQSFAFDHAGFFLGNTCYFIRGKEVWLTALLNSAIIEWFYGAISNRIRGGYLRAFSDYMKQIPIPSATPQQQAELGKLVGRIVSAKERSADLTEMESEANERVYRLFGLTREEIALVESA